MSGNPFDYLNAINVTKEDLLADALPEDEKKYAPFMVNRGLSYFPDTVLFANEMNRYYNLDNKMQFDFLRTAVRKRKRFSKWNKAETTETVELIKEVYGYSEMKAREVSDLFTGDDVERMRRQVFKGGKRK